MRQIKCFLTSRGLPSAIADDLIALLPEKMPESSCAWFCDADSIMNPDRWFCWPEQNRFVLVGQCPNGDGIGLDTELEPGAVHFIAHELIGSGARLEDMTVKVADSPSDYARKVSALGDAFPMDYWEACRSGHVQNGAALCKRCAAFRCG